MKRFFQPNIAFIGSIVHINWYSLYKPKIMVDCLVRVPTKTHIFFFFFFFSHKDIQVINLEFFLTNDEFELRVCTF
jgi:hypothetical protein